MSVETKCDSCNESIRNYDNYKIICENCLKIKQYETDVQIQNLIAENDSLYDQVDNLTENIKRLQMELERIQND